MAEEGHMNKGDHMKAVIIHGYGGPDVIELADVPVPQPGTGQVRIRVHAAPVHPVDIATRAGRLAEHGLMATSGDVGLGWDLAGVVDALGLEADQFAAGDAVVGMRDLLTAPVGAQAEQVVLDINAVAPAPRSVTPVEASTIPLNSLTADQALDLLALRSGQWLLVTGASLSRYTTRTPGKMARAVSCVFGTVGMPQPRSMNCVIPWFAAHVTARARNWRFSRVTSTVSGAAAFSRSAASRSTAKLSFPSSR